MRPRLSPGMSEARLVWLEGLHVGSFVRLVVEYADGPRREKIANVSGVARDYVTVCGHRYSRKTSRVLIAASGGNAPNMRIEPL